MYSKYFSEHVVLLTSAEKYYMFRFNQSSAEQVSAGCNVTMPLPSSYAGSSSNASNTGQTPGNSSQQRPNPTMGNGASATQIVIDGEALDLSKVRVVLPELRQQIKLKDAELERYRIELKDLRALLRQKDTELSRCKAEIDKFRSVLDVTLHRDGKPDILSTIHEDVAMAGQEARLGNAIVMAKKQGVSGESWGAEQGTKPIELKRFDKDFR